MPLPTETLWGSCRITAYCSCATCCRQWAANRPTDAQGNPIVKGARGTILVPGVSVACNLPFGTELRIDGLEGTFTVDDRTGQSTQERYNGMTVDIYMDNHDACWDLLGGQPEWMEVYILNG